MATMKVALHDGRGTMEVVEAPRPEAGPGEVVVRVRCSGICGSDLNRYAVNTTPEKLPSGHEVAGEVVEVGSGAESWRIGDRVAIDTLAQGRACGHCWYPQRGQYNTCQNKVGDGGGFAEYIRRLADGCFRLPDGLSWEEGALVEPLAVGVHGLRRGNLASGETVVVLGSGTIGLTTLVAARALGAERSSSLPVTRSRPRWQWVLGPTLRCPRRAPSYGRQWRQPPTGVAPMWWWRQ